MTTWPQPFDLAATLTCGQCFRWKRNADGSFSRRGGRAHADRFPAVAGGRARRSLLAAVFRPRKRLCRHLRRAGRAEPRARRRPSRKRRGCASCGRTPGKHCAPLFFRRTITSRGSRGLWSGCAPASGTRCRAAAARSRGRSGWPRAPWRIWPRCGAVSVRPMCWTQRGAWQAAFRSRRSAGFRLRRRGKRCARSAAWDRRWRNAPCFTACTGLTPSPVDVWMNRAMASFFPGVQPETFGPYAGVAQQALFVYSRNHPDQVREPARRAAKSRKR